MTHDAQKPDSEEIDRRLAEVTSADEALRRRVAALQESEQRLTATEQTFRLLVQSVRDYAIFMH